MSQDEHEEKAPPEAEAPPAAGPATDEGGRGEITGELELFREPSVAEKISAPGIRPITRPLRVVAVSGAKGGVGKSLLATNLGIYLATIGRKVVLVDADAEAATLHTFLGEPRPGKRARYQPPMPEFRTTWVGDELSSPFEEGEVEVAPPPPGEGTGEPTVAGPPIGEPVETAIPGLSLVLAGVDEVPVGEVRRASLRNLVSRLRELEAEFVVVDLGAGTHRVLLDAWLDADLSLFVSVPEPTAIENTYRFVRAVAARALRRNVSEPDRHRRLVHWQRRLGHHPAPLDLALRLADESDDLETEVRAFMEGFRFRMVLNQTRLRADLELGDRMRSAALRRLGLHLDYLGYVDQDDSAWNCVRARRPLLVESPGSKASRSIEKIARRLLAIDAGTARSRVLRSAPPDTHHDLLEVERGATEEEIRRAYKRSREVYSNESLCCYGLFDAEDIDALRIRLDEAHDVLLDPALRRPYELSVFPPDRKPQHEGKKRRANEPRPPAPLITPDTEFTGALIRAVRESQGISLDEIGDETKIGLGYLNDIEADAFASLPAQVYVRGFVTQIARILDLDTEQVSRTYVRRYRRWAEGAGGV